MASAMEDPPRVEPRLIEPEPGADENKIDEPAAAEAQPDLAAELEKARAEAAALKDQLLRALAEAETGLSERRRGVQQVMDGLAGELGRRYRDGEADVAALLADEGRH